MEIRFEVFSGSERRSEVVLSSEERWVSVWLMSDVAGCVGGRTSGKGPRRRAFWRGALASMWAWSVVCVRGPWRAFTYGKG